MNPRPQAPGAKPSNPEPVDWRARSQGLEEALRNLRRRHERREKLHPSDFTAPLGLPDEEGEEIFSGMFEPIEDSGDGAAPPPRGTASQCADVDVLRDAWAIGDSLQSSASRLAEFAVARVDDGEDVPYEVHMAAVEAIAQVGEWTEFRMASEPEAAGASTEPDDGPAAGQGAK